jgi:uncharacterized protein involved in outer membrane biogenesis
MIQTRNRRVILAVCAAIVAAVLAFYFFAPKLIRAHAAGAMRSEFGSDVRFQSLEVSGFPRIHIVVRDLLIGTDPAHPLIQASTADASLGLLPWHVRSVVLGGLSIQLPTANEPIASAPKVRATVTADEIVAEHATVQISSLHFQLTDLRVTNFNPAHAAGFSAVLVNPEPRADVPISGQIGPWNAQAPSLTPVQGNYTLPGTNLASVPGLEGMLSSQGRFQGVLQRIRITGDANVGRPHPSQASFQIVVDAADGSAAIDSMNGSLQDSPFTASGQASHIQDDRLREIALKISMPQGRLQDVLPLGVKSKEPPMTGALRMQARLQVMPGAGDLLDRLRLDGDFTATNARFSSLDLRERLRNLSRKAEGHPNDESAGSSISSMQGQVQLEHGIARFTDLVIDLEGASARLNGTYQLASERLDLQGEVTMDAKVSQTATGAKALLLKVADPFFRSKHGGSRVPIKITGTRSDPQFGVDLASKVADQGTHAH